MKINDKVNNETKDWKEEGHPCYVFPGAGLVVLFP
jgi:hypothetical protein